MSEPRDIDRAHELMMAALDAELSDAGRAELNRLLDSNEALRDEWNRLQHLQEVTGAMTMKRAPDEVWDGYWTSVYRRMERGIGWILLSLGTIVLISYGLWEGVKEMLADASMPAYLKAAILAAIVGAVMLTVSVVREKYFVRKTDPYKDIQR